MGFMPSAFGSHLRLFIFILVEESPNSHDIITESNEDGVILTWPNLVSYDIELIAKGKWALGATTSVELHIKGEW